MKMYVKSVCMILFAAGIAVNAASTRSTSSSVKSNLEKIKKNNSKRIAILLKKEPKTAMLHNRIAYLYYTLGKYKNSEYHYKQAIQYNSRNIEARLGLYLISSANKDYAQAVTYCREIKSIDNLNYYGNLYFIYAKMAQHKYKSAAIACRKMLTAYPCDITFLRLLKLNYTYQKQALKAKQVQADIDILR